LLGTGELPFGSLAGSALLVLIVLGTGLLYFRRMERTFADVI
jgi:ABC-type polysaccharide/polyol phosphate export permease